MFLLWFNFLSHCFSPPLLYVILTRTEWCFFQRYYTPTARELARLAQIQITPILHHFSESLAGAASIRAFDQEHRFVYTNLGLVDGFSKPWFHNVSAMEWLSFRLNLLSNFVFAFSLVMLVSLPEGIINPSKCLPVFSWKQKQLITVKNNYIL